MGGVGGGTQPSDSPGAPAAGSWTLSRSQMEVLPSAPRGRRGGEGGGSEEARSPGDLSPGGGGGGAELRGRAWRRVVSLWRRLLGMNS